MRVKGKMYQKLIKISFLAFSLLFNKQNMINGEQRVNQLDLLYSVSFIKDTIIISLNAFETLHEFKRNLFCMLQNGIILHLLCDLCNVPIL